MTFVTRLPASILSIIYSELFLLSMQPYFSAVPCFAFMPTHAYVGCLMLFFASVKGDLELSHCGNFPATGSSYLSVFLKTPHFEEAVMSKVGIKIPGRGRHTPKEKYSDSQEFGK